MKKILFLAAVTAVALSSCSKNEIVDNSTDPSNAIGFGTYVGTSTKVTEETGFITGDKFLVHAYVNKNSSGTAVNFTTPKATSAAQFMFNQEVTAVGTESAVPTSWTYSPIKYWPNETNDQVSFFAVTNGSATLPVNAFNSTAETDDTDAVAFTLTANPTTDIMIASLLNKKESSSAITFSFIHTMAKVVFYAEKEDGIDANTTVTVTSLEVNYGTTPVSAGTFTFANTANNAGSWTITKEGTANSTSGDLVTTDITMTEADQNLGQIMLIPTDVTDIKVTVTYDVETKVTSNGTSYNDSKITNVTTFNINAPSAMNTIYNYNLDIDLTAVSLSGSVGSWESSAVSKDVTIASSTGTVGN